MANETPMKRGPDRMWSDDHLTRVLKMPPPWLFVLTIALGVLTSAADRAAARDGADRLNVILLMTDDQGYGDLGYYGNEMVRTPHLDRLAENSVRLEDFHVGSYCAPTRAALLTGRLPVRTGVTSTNHLRNNLPAREVLMSEFFQASGYRTGIFGKWHLGGTYPFRPIDRGFDEWLGLGDGGLATASDHWGNDRWNDTYWHNGEPEQRDGFCTDVYFDGAMRFMRRAKKAGKPFFTYLATNVPHTDWNVKKEWLRAYNGIGRDLAGFYASTERADHNVGRLLDFLEHEGLRENTLLVFLTDNGSATPSDSAPNGGMRGRKGSMYDGGHRVPCFLSGPERIVGEPRAIDELTSCVDLLPTFVELCDLRQPDPSHLPFDGRSLVPLLRNPDADWPNRKLFFHQLNGMDPPRKNAPSVVITPRWRLIDRKKLYDIKADPDQSNNVADAHPGVVRRLRRAHDRFWRESDVANREPPRSVLGPVELRLTPDNSRGGTIWQEGVAGGRESSGRWPLRVAEAGRYRFEIRRWPRPVNQPLKSGIPAEKPDPELAYVPPKHTPLPEGKQLPIEKVRISFGKGKTVTKSATGQPTHVTFKRELKVGQFTLEVEFLDDDGERIQGAYYVYAARAE